MFSIANVVRVLPYIPTSRTLQSEPGLGWGSSKLPGPSVIYQLWNWPCGCCSVTTSLCRKGFRSPPPRLREELSTSRPVHRTSWAVSIGHRFHLSVSWSGRQREGSWETPSPSRQSTCKLCLLRVCVPVTSPRARGLPGAAGRGQVCMFSFRAKLGLPFIKTWFLLAALLAPRAKLDDLF